MNAFVIGVSSWDTLIYVDRLPEAFKEDMSLWAQKTTQSIGGTGAGKALALDVLGCDVTLATELGDDQAKTNIMNVFQNHPNIQLRVLEANQTTTHTNIMYKDGHRLSIFTKTSSEVAFDPTLEKDIVKSDVVFLNINPYCKAYIPIIKKHQKKMVVDIHDYDLGNQYHEPFIDAADILFVSGVNIKDQSSFLKNHIQGKDAVIITNGKQGSLAIDQSMTIYKQSAYHELLTVDTNGAGDTFSAAFTKHYLENHDMKMALKYASIAAGYACASETLYHPNANDELIQALMSIDF